MRTETENQKDNRMLPPHSIRRRLRLPTLSTLATVALLLVAALTCHSTARADDGLRQRLKDANGVRTDVWVYNDIGAALEQAKRENKPLFVTFRCVPCRACAAFDAEVAAGSVQVRALAKQKFVSVRQVEMKNVDLSLFQFDHDLNWAAMFINADGVVYARYGTQSAAGPDAYNSLEGLLNTMERVLEMHAAYPKNLAELKGKRGHQKKGLTALELPGMKNAKKLEKLTTRSNCVHCHMIHDAAHFAAQENGSFRKDLLWKYPLPDTVGIKIDRNSGVRVREVPADSPAARAGLKKGDEILRMNGQRIASIADMQWVLHHLPNQDTTLKVETRRSSLPPLQLKRGWKEYDVSWRGSIWSVSPRLRVWAPQLPAARRKSLNIPEANAALLVKWINRGSRGGRAAFEAGLRQGDVIVAMAGKPLEKKLTPAQFNVHVKLNYQVGDVLPLTVLRKGKRRTVRVRLVE